MIRATTLLLTMLLWPLTASAQLVTEATGNRALGMGGAFVAVADDATAVYWNPAGLLNGPSAGMTIGWLDFRTGDQSGPPVVGATSRTSRFVSLGTWPIGLSYGHFHETALTPAADGTLGTLRGETFAVSEVGATFVQTLVHGLVIGSTFRYMRGSVVSGPVTGQTTHDALDAAESRDGPTTGHFDFDVGVMVDFKKARLGVTMRNLHEATFGGGDEVPITLKRHARAGLAVFPATGLTFALDLDLDTADPRGGPRRILAMGGEGHLGNRWAARSGIRWSLAGDQRRTAAVGGSFAIRKSFWLDWQYTQGRSNGDRGYGISIRAGS